MNFILLVEKIAQPEEIANVFAFLASDRASRDACALRFAREEAQVVGFDISS